MADREHDFLHFLCARKIPDSNIQAIKDEKVSLLVTLVTIQRQKSNMLFPPVIVICKPVVDCVLNAWFD